MTRVTIESELVHDITVHRGAHRCEGYLVEYSSIDYWTCALGHHLEPVYGVEGTGTGGTGREGGMCRHDMRKVCVSKETEKSDIGTLYGIICDVYITRVGRRVKSVNINRMYR